MRHFNETFCWDILMKHFDETYLWDILMRHIDETFWWNIFMAGNGWKFVPNMTRLVIKFMNCTTGLDWSSAMIALALLIRWLRESFFCSRSAYYFPAQTKRVWELKVWENVHPPPMCHMSSVTCHVSHFTCHMSCGTSISTNFHENSF